MNESASLAWRIWERKGLLGTLLWLMLVPLSFLYSLGVRIRNFLYSAGWISAQSLPCAVVSIGNLTVGGTGKTPTTLWLAQELGNRGYRVAILSRGYRGHERGPAVERSVGKAIGGNSLNLGDEATMMAEVFGQTVGVGKKRYAVGTRLLQEREIDVFLLDDGFQHRQLRRDVDLLLLGGDWNGSLIPAGPFREPKAAVRRADLFLVTGAAEKWEPVLAQHQKQSALFLGSLQPRSLVSLEDGQWKEHPLSVMARSRILTVCGIAKPLSFYRMIRDWEGEIVDAMEFPDHHAYSTDDWRRITQAARGVDLIVTTEKDITKLLFFPFAKGRLFALRVVMEVQGEEALVRMVEETVRERKVSHLAAGGTGQ